MVKNKQDYGDFANIFVASLLMSARNFSWETENHFLPKKTSRTK